MGPKMKEGYLGKWVSGFDQLLGQAGVLIVMVLYMMAFVAFVDTAACMSGGDFIKGKPHRGAGYVVITVVVVGLLDALRAHMVILGDSPRPVYPHAQASLA